MKSFMRICLTIFLSTLLTSPFCPAAQSGRVVIKSIQAGPTPFISFLFLTPDFSIGIESVRFTIAPKPGSVTRPVSVTYSKNYLQSRGFISGVIPQIMLPVFGLYANYLNTVILTYEFSDGSTDQQFVLVPTVAFPDPCGYGNPTVIQARTTARDLSYDYMLLKNVCGTFSPTILDSDGEIRWVGTAGVTDTPSTLFQNAVYIANGPNLYRTEFDGASSVVREDGNGPVAFHHNIDYGKRGLILDENTPEWLESVNVEVDAEGNILKTWNLATIISNEMIAGGDDPTQFVHPDPVDWFHNNAVAYHKSDDSLVISSRENFAICIDYETGAIKWILGDPTKQWYQFPSLRKFALTLGPDSLPPIGQHAVSFTDDDKLLLFDDGRNSITQMPPGENRSYSAPRKYDINPATRVATEVWNYPNGQSLFSPFCSSVYEDQPSNYLVDYAIISNLGTTPFMELLGLSSSGAKVFDYRYADTSCDQAWNAIPVHLDNMRFTTIVPLSAVSRKTHGDAGTFDVPLPLSGRPGIECRSGGAAGEYQMVVTFPASVTAASATVTSEPGETAAVSGPPISNGGQVTVNLSNVSNAQTVTVNLVGVTDGVTTDTVSVSMSILVGDVGGNGAVSSSDIAQTKLQMGQPVTASTYRYDVTAGGLIALADVFLVESLTGTAIDTH